jgi:hypothetical protein
VENAVWLILKVAAIGNGGGYLLRQWLVIWSCYTELESQPYVGCQHWAGRDVDGFIDSDYPRPFEDMCWYWQFRDAQSGNPQHNVYGKTGYFF